MKIGTGIKGIRKFLADNANKANWHIMSRPEGTEDYNYSHHSTGTVDSIRTFYSDRVTLTGYQGNVLYITIKKEY